MKPNLLPGVPPKVIMAISEKNNYLAKVVKESHTTIAHATKIMNRLEECKLLTKTKDGRKMIIKLTNKGLELQSHLNAIKSLI